MRDTESSNTKTSPQALVSVIVRTVNRPGLLSEALLSIATQRYPNIEVVLVNDGGPSVLPLTKEFEGAFQLRLIEHKERMGRCVAANVGLDECKGKYICFLDDDDIFYPHHLTTLVDILENTDYKIAYTDSFETTYIPGRVEQTYDLHDINLRIGRDFDFQLLLRDNFIPILCPLIEVSCFQHGARFDESLEVCEDWDLWIQLAQHYPFLHVPVATSQYSKRIDGTNTVGNRLHVWLWTRDMIIDRYRHLQDPNAKPEMGCYVN